MEYLPLPTEHRDVPEIRLEFTDILHFQVSSKEPVACKTAASKLPTHRPPFTPAYISSSPEASLKRNEFRYI